jgi:hypothetical protein
VLTVGSPERSHVEQLAVEAAMAWRAGFGVRFVCAASELANRIEHRPSGHFMTMRGELVPQSSVAVKTWLGPLPRKCGGM